MTAQAGVFFSIILTSHWGLVEDEDEAWLRRDRHHMLWIPVQMSKGGVADPYYLDEIAQLHHQAFSDAGNTQK